MIANIICLIIGLLIGWSTRGAYVRAMWNVVYSLRDRAEGGRRRRG